MMLNTSRQWLHCPLTLISLGLLSACGEKTAQENARQSKVQIVGGKPIADDVTDARRFSTVALTTDFLSNVRTGALTLFDSGRSFCSATIISRRALMTAAHCLEEFDIRSKQKTNTWILPEAAHFVASFGTKVDRDGAWLRAKKVVPHPDWSPLQTLSGNPSQPPNDIGVVILEKEIPGEYQPVKVASEDFQLKEQQPVTLVGYGVTLSRMRNNTGVLREVQLPLQGVDRGNRILNVGSWMKGACAGDSGGPMYAQDSSGTWHVVGVTSAGIEIFSTCIGLDNSYTDARPYRDWLRAILREHGDDLL